MPEESSADEKQPRIPGRTILIVDDEPQVRDALKRLLDREGYDVRLAESGQQALETLRRDPIKLVISDQNMPGMTGIELFKLMRERHPQVCRIMLTSDPKRDTIIRSVNEGEVYRFIEKPWDNTLVRVTVYFAFEAVQLADENRRLVAALRRQMQLVRDLEREYPYLAALARDEDAPALLAMADRERDQES